MLIYFLWFSSSSKCLIRVLIFGLFVDLRLSWFRCGWWSVGGCTKDFRSLRLKIKDQTFISRGTDSVPILWYHLWRNNSNSAFLRRVFETFAISALPIFKISEIRWPNSRKQKFIIQAAASANKDVVINGTNTETSCHCILCSFQRRFIE